MSPAAAEQIRCVLRERHKHTDLEGSTKASDQLHLYPSFAEGSVSIHGILQF
jgi:hypothetical protein